MQIDCRVTTELRNQKKNIFNTARNFQWQSKQMDGQVNNYGEANKTNETENQRNWIIYLWKIECQKYGETTIIETHKHIHSTI